MTSGAIYRATGEGVLSRRRLTSPVARAGFAAGAFFIAFTALLQSGWLDAATASTVTDLTFIALGLVYVPLAARTAVSTHGRVRAAWAAMTIGFAFWLLGEVLWAFYGLSAEAAPSPSWADAAYLAYYPWVCFALLLFPTNRSWRKQAQVVLDAVIVTGSFFIISWLTVMRPVWQQETAGAKLEFIVSTAYPAGDVMIMTMGILVLIRAAPGLRLPLKLLVAGLMAAAVADSLWLYTSDTSGYSAGSPVDLLYAANALLIIVALIAGYRSVPGDPAGSAAPGLFVRSLPLVPLGLCAVFLGVAQPAEVTETPVVVTGLLVVVSLAVRHVLSAAELGKREREVQTMADRLSGELASASKYVASVLPGDLDGPVRVRARYLPSREIGGDSYGYLCVDDDHLVVYVIDVSGHGVEPALLSVSVHNLLRSRSMPTETLLSPERVIMELNTCFDMDGHDDHFFTIWYGVYQISTRELRYAAAGHPPALALTNERDLVNATPLGGTSIPVGMFADTVFTADTYQVPAGAQILVCSDGVFSDRLSFTGFTALCEDVARTAGWTPASLIARLRAKGGTVNDDCALVQLTF